MQIEHLAIWTNQLEPLKAFYQQFFGTTSNEKYYNSRRQFSSYFLSFSNGARLELMQVPDVLTGQNDAGRPLTGLTHFAISVGSKEKVDALTETVRVAGFSVVGEPRWTGDGYHESVISDPDNNQVEITI